MTDFLLTHGSYLAITVLLILSGSGLPIPEEVPIIAAGLLSANDKMDPVIAFACCLFGAIAGDCIMYWIGYHFGRGVLREHHWWARLITPEREAQVEAKFRRHGLKVFFLTRFLVLLRSPVYLTAGILRVSFKRFFFIDLICATAVVGTFFGLTYLFGKHIAEWVNGVALLLSVVAVIALAGAALYLWRRHHRRMAQAKHCDLEHTANACSDSELPECERQADPRNCHSSRTAVESPVERVGREKVG